MSKVIYANVSDIQKVGNKWEGILNLTTDEGLSFRMKKIEKTRKAILESPKDYLPIKDAKRDLCCIVLKLSERDRQSKRYEHCIDGYTTLISGSFSF